MAVIIAAIRIGDNIDRTGTGLNDLIYQFLADRGWNVNTVSVTGNGIAIAVIGSNSDNLNTVGSNLVKALRAFAPNLSFSLINVQFHQRDAGNGNGSNNNSPSPKPPELTWEQWFEEYQTPILIGVATVALIVMRSSRY